MMVGIDYGEPIGDYRLTADDFVIRQRSEIVWEVEEKPKEESEESKAFRRAAFSRICRSRWMLT